MPKRIIENPVLSTRYVSLHAEFKLDGNSRDELKLLMDLWIEVQSHLNRVNARELRQKARERQELGDAIDKLSPLVATSRHPQLFKELAAMEKMWPVLASDEPGWEKAVVSQVNGLELGKRLACLKTRIPAPHTASGARRDTFR